MRKFDNLMLIGRAGSGKSEFIDFLKGVAEADRLEKYYIGPFEEIDDFPWLYSLFKDEDIWEYLGIPRSLAEKREKVYVTKDYGVYDFLTLKFNIEIGKRYLGRTDFYGEKTLFIEFARGRESCFRKTFNLLDKEIFEDLAVIFLDNTFEESMRRNLIRSTDDDHRQTILNHRIPLEVMEYYYRTHDWHEMTCKKPCGYVEAHGLKVPFVTIWNMPEVHDFKALEERYSGPIKKLWELYSGRS